MKGCPFAARFDRSHQPYGKENPTNEAKYMGLDAHQTSISAAVLDWCGASGDGMRAEGESGERCRLGPTEKITYR